MKDTHRIIAIGELNQALNQASEVFKSDPSSSVEIQLENTYYRLDETLMITRENGPGLDGALRFVPVENAHPRIGSAVEVSGWKPVDQCEIPEDILLSKAQKNLLMVATAPEKAGYIHTMFKGDSILPRGRRCLIGTESN